MPMPNGLTNTHLQQLRRRQRWLHHRRRRRFRRRRRHHRFRLLPGPVTLTQVV